jgi:nitrate reductase (cytochrome), electron transfer subunit
MRRWMKPGARHVALAIAVAIAAGAHAAGPTKEVNDGIDVYFRDADFGALSDQAVATYPSTDAGDAALLPRAFPDAPPQIPHSVEDMLPITADDNECLNCHDPENATSKADAPLPESHFIRPVMAEGKKGSPMAWVVQKYEKGPAVYGARYNCVMCHTPQATNARVLDSNFVRLERGAAE